MCDTPVAPVGAQTAVFQPKPLGPVCQSPAWYVLETPTPRKHRDKRLEVSYLINPQKEQVPPPPQPSQQWPRSLDEVEIIAPRPRAPSLTCQKVEATIARWESDSILKGGELARDLERSSHQLRVHWTSPLQVLPDSRSLSPPLLTPAGNERLQQLFGREALEREVSEMEFTRLHNLMEMEKKQWARLDLEERQCNADRSARARWV
ncbi:hypothetical protein PG985_006493 [Apiospora marii]|uniref:uncharacterized protein n=1 Tax=Apiospora marii TaxID=335849 RepID=UPI00312DCC80